MREPIKSELSQNIVVEKDEQLIRRAVAGDKEAFDRLVSRYRDRVYNLARHMLKDPVAAEDIAQDVFVRAYRALKNFRQQSGFYTWLYRIAVNLVYTQAKRESRRREVYHEAYKEHRQMLAKSYDSPEELAMSGELSDMILCAIKELDPRFRQVLILREIEGFDVAEVAKILSLPKGTVKSRLFRAREDLRKRIQAKRDQEKEGK